ASGRNDLGGKQVVAGETMLAREPTYPSAKREPAYAGVGHDARRRSEPKRLRRTVEVAEDGPALDAGSRPHGIDTNASHWSQIGHETAIAYRLASDVVPAAAHRDQKIVLPRDPHRVDDVSRAGTTDDERRPLVDHAVPNLADIVVVLVIRTDKLTTEA